MISYLPIIPIFPLLCCDAIAISEQQQILSQLVDKTVAVSQTYHECVNVNFKHCLQGYT